MGGKILRSATIGLILLLAVTASVNAARNPRAGKKLIEYGWDVPNSYFLKTNIEKMEQIPFDGIVIRGVTYQTPNGGPELLAWRVFSRHKFQPADYQHVIDDVKSIKFTRFKDNFIEMCSHPGEVDFFDPDWDIAVHNARCMAKIAKESGCVGLTFDPEKYGEFPTWGYEARPEKMKKAYSFAEYTARVRECGRKFMKAINSEFPDVKILAWYGHSLPYLDAKEWTGGRGLQYAYYALLPAFYDGMLDVATPQTQFIDGHEFAYSYGSRKQYLDARKRVLREAKTISQCPEEFTEHVRCGFGVWADYDWRTFGWHPDDFSKNYWTPGALRTALSHALASSDEYVWVYSEKLCWWDFNVPKEYIDALALAKTGPGPEEGGKPYPPK